MAAPGTVTHVLEVAAALRDAADAHAQSLAAAATAASEIQPGVAPSRPPA